VCTADGCLHYDADAINLAVKSSCGEIIGNLMTTDNLEVVFPVCAKSNKPDRHCNRFL